MSGKKRGRRQGWERKVVMGEREKERKKEREREREIERERDRYLDW